MTNTINSLIISFFAATLYDLFPDLDSKIKIIVISLLFIIYILFNLNQYNKENKIKIEINNENLMQKPYSIKFDATNLGNKKKVLKKSINFEGISPPREPQKAIFNIEENDLSLEPCKRKSFTAIIDRTHRSDRILGFCWFQKYKFQTLQGGFANSIYKRHAGKTISRLEYTIDRFLFHRLNRIFRKFRDQE
ncbi:MAG: hypothetical protein GY874_00945 [Desulfobacteraceae bacterium]|nr:hypothetical protein [Desulfobacteraceae bacterium]